MIPLGPLAAALVPAIATATIAALLAAATVRRALRPKRAQVFAALAPAIGAAIGFYLVLGAAALQPRQATDRVTYSVVILLACGIVDILLVRRAAVRIPLRIAAVAATATMLLLPLVQNSWSTMVSATSIAGAGVIIVALWESHDASARRGNSVIVAAVLLLTLTGVSVITLFGGSAKLAQLIGVAVSAFGGLAALTWISPPRFPISGCIAVVWPIAALIALLGATYSDTPPLPLALAPAACLTPWLLRIPALARRAAWQRIAVCIAAAAALLGPAIFLAYRAYSATASEYGY